jgi:hypothetical protein
MTKILISRKNFASPYPVISLNAPEGQINDCVWRVQDTNLRSAIGNDLYADFIQVYQNENVIINVIVGNQTTITLNNITGLQVGYFASFKDLQGTIGASMNGQQFEILAISANDVTIGLNSTGKGWTAGGLLERIFTPAYRALFAYIEPYMIYTSYALYVPLGAVQSTASGLMVHNVGEATHMTDKRIGEIVNQYTQTANTYLVRLLDFLANNNADYPLFKQTESSNTSNPIFFGKKNKFKGVNI